MDINKLGFLYNTNREMMYCASEPCTALEPYKPGRYCNGPGWVMRQFPTSAISRSYTAADKRSIRATSSTGQSVQLDLSVQFKLEPKKLSDLFNEFGVRFGMNPAKGDEDQDNSEMPVDREIVKIVSETDCSPACRLTRVLYLTARLFVLTSLFHPFSLGFSKCFIYKRSIFSTRHLSRQRKTLPPPSPPDCFTLTAVVLPTPSTRR